MNNSAGYTNSGYGVPDSYNPDNPYYTYPWNQWNGHFDYGNTVYGQAGGCYCKKSYLRILNTYDDVDFNVQINEIVMAENLKTGKYTRYAQFSPGTYRVKICKSTEPEKLIFESVIAIDRNLTYTGVIAADEDDSTDICMLMIPEAKENAIAGKMSALRLSNLAFDSPDLELIASDGTVLLSDLCFGGVSCNLAIPSGRYELTLREKRSKNRVKAFKADFAPRMHYTLFVTGKCGNEHDVKIIIPEDGVNYLELC